jgi:hypothetical protein
VGVGSDNENVAKVSGGALLAGRLAMKVNDSRLDGATERFGIEFGGDAAERIFHRLHEQSPQRVDDESASSVLGFDQHGSRTGRAREIVDRPYEEGTLVNELQSLLPVPGMIAQSDGIRAGSENFAVDR